MKKVLIGALIGLFLIVIIVFAFVKKEVKIINKAEIEERTIKDISYENLKESENSVDFTNKIMTALEKELGDNLKLYDDYIEIDDLNNNGEKYLVTVRDAWNDNFYLAKENEKGEIDLKKIDSGLARISSIQRVSISEGDFWGVFSGTHMGNGSFRLYSIEEPNDLKYEINSVIDCNHEAKEVYLSELANEIDEKIIKSINEEKVLLSKSYENDKLTPCFEYDINKDGNTDIVFSGIENSYLDMVEGENILIAKHYREDVYLFDEKKNEFVLNEELSLKKKIK